MKLYQYLLLDEQLQYLTIWEIGKYIDAVLIHGVRYLLYAINDFFVEVHYKVRTNEIIGKNQFKQGEHLEVFT